MNCYYCGNKMKIKYKSPICSDCEEASNMIYAIEVASEQWENSLKKDEDLWQEALSIIYNIIPEINQNLDFKIRAQCLEEKIIEIIENEISYYNKNDLMVSTMLIKETIRLETVEEVKKEEYWLMINELEAALILQKIILSMNNNRFIGFSLDKKFSKHYGLVIAINLARILYLLRENMQRYKYENFTNDLMDLVTDLYENEALEKYYEKIIQFQGKEKPEDIKFINPDLKKYLNKRGLSQEKIFNALKKNIKNLVGFDFNKVQNMYEDLIIKSENSNIPLKILHKHNFYKNAKKYLSKKEIDNFVRLFSINKTLELYDEDYDPIEKWFELRSIYETDIFLVFGRIDLTQNLFIFKQFSMSTHFIELYFPSFEPPQDFIKSQQRMSELLAYKIADRLEESGYILPTEITSKDLGNKQVVMAEIDKILNNSSNNILQSLGDIDILALNNQKNEILVIELKHYKPGINMKDLALKDRNKIIGKNLEQKMMNREIAIRENIKTVIKFIYRNKTKSFSRINKNKYKIRSILLTVRPNFFAIENELNFEYMTWMDFINNLKKGEL